ncbi:MAG: hypothetical protein HYZ13_07570 [Acidobacteria bacterium]|nr:hypothetical protein [Acidobacteriota bacterium]
MSKREWNLKSKDSPYTMTLSGGWTATVDATGTVVTMTYAGTVPEVAGGSSNMAIDPDPGDGTGKP